LAGFMQGFMGTRRLLRTSYFRVNHILKGRQLLAVCLFLDMCPAKLDPINQLGFLSVQNKKLLSYSWIPFLFHLMVVMDRKPCLKIKVRNVKYYYIFYLFTIW
jgi:hypothetical protein